MYSTHLDARLQSQLATWKLSARYNPAVLALKASGKLKDAGKMDWDEIVAFVNNHERSEQRLNGDDTLDGRAMATTMRGRRRGAHRDGAAETRDCFNCGETGHLARNCKKARRARQHEGEEDDDDDDEAGAARESATPREGAAATARRRGDRRHLRAAAIMALTSDEELDEYEVGGHQGLRGELRC